MYLWPDGKKRSIRPWHNVGFEPEAEAIDRIQTPTTKRKTDMTMTTKPGGVNYIPNDAATLPHLPTENPGAIESVAYTLDCAVVTMSNAMTTIEQLHSTLFSDQPAELPSTIQNNVTEAPKGSLGNLEAIAQRVQSLAQSINVATEGLARKL